MSDIRRPAVCFKLKRISQRQDHNWHNIQFGWYQVFAESIGRGLNVAVTLLELLILHLC